MLSITGRHPLATGTEPAHILTTNGPVSRMLYADLLLLRKNAGWNEKRVPPAVRRWV